MDNKNESTEIQILDRQLTYAVENIDKVNERITKMAQFMAESHKRLQEMILEVKAPPRPMKNLKPNRSEQTGELATAMAKAKCAFGFIAKGAQANRGKYANLTDMLEICLPILQEHGIDASFLVEGDEFDRLCITLTVTHSSGQWFSTTAPLNEDQSQQSLPFHQKIGSAEKYMRRYMFRAMFNLTEDSE